MQAAIHGEDGDEAASQGEEWDEEEFDEEEEDEEEPSQPITLPLIESLCLDVDEDAPIDEKYDAMLSLTRLELDNQRIGYISNLDTLTNLRSISLRQNRIRRITGLDMLTNLEMLSLSDNWIEGLQGLSNLAMLRTLDLAQNRIESVEGLSKQVPSGVVSLQLNGNPCALELAYRATVVTALPALIELDCVKVSPTERVASHRAERLATPAGQAPPSAPESKRVEDSELDASVAELYAAAMDDAMGKMNAMKVDFSARLAERAKARQEQREANLQ